MSFARQLYQEYSGSLDEYQTFDLDELPNQHLITEEESKFFVDEIKKTLRTFRNNINVNEQTVREYVSIFMKTAVEGLRTIQHNYTLKPILMELKDMAPWMGPLASRQDKPLLL